MKKDDFTNYDFIWKVDNLSFLQNHLWLPAEYRAHDFIFTGINNGETWKMYLDRTARAQLSDDGYELVKNNWSEYCRKIKVQAAALCSFANLVDETDFSSRSSGELVKELNIMFSLGNKLVGTYMFLDYFCHDKIQSEIERLGINDRSHLVSSPLENFVTREEYERWKLSKNHSEHAIKEFLETYAVVPFKDCNPKWNRETLLKNISSLRNVEEKIKSLDEIHQEIISNRKSHWLTDTVRSLQQEKFFLRIFINKFFFPNSVLDKILEEISMRLNMPKKLLHSYSNNEIVDMLQGQKIAISDRTNFVLMRSSNWQGIFGDEALEIISHLEDEKIQAPTFLKGHVANKGFVIGRVKVIPLDLKADLAKKIEEMNPGDILVSGSTGPEMMRALHKAGAIVTEEGGIASHAAIISRELDIPCVVGTKIATKVLKDGDLVEVDANEGIVTIIERNKK